MAGNIGKLVKEYRKNRDYTLRELSERSGLHYSYIAKIEAGKVKQPSRDTVRRLAAELGAPAGVFEMACGYLPLDKVGEGIPDYEEVLTDSSRLSLEVQSVLKALIDVLSKNKNNK